MSKHWRGQIDVGSAALKVAPLLALGAILITAAFLRFYGLVLPLEGLGWLPPGLFHDEAAIGLDALDVLERGQFPIYFERTTGGQEPLFGYLTALAMLALGPNTLAMRVVAPVVGLLTVAVTYALGKEMLGRWVGLIAALLMAVSYWHVHISHTSFRAITLPLMVGLTFLLLWRALRRDTLGSYLLAGLSGGATMYTYQSSRLFPLLMTLTFLYLWVCRGRSLPWKGVAAFAGVMAGLSLPLAWYYLGHPAIFSARIEQVGTEGAGLWENAVNALGMFSYRGDITWKFNLPGKPVFDWPDSILFYLGVLVALRHWRDPRYGLLLLWVAVMLLPTILSTESPHFLRAMGIMPGVYLFPALGAVWVAGWVWGRLPRDVPRLANPQGAALAYLLLAAWLGLGAAATYRDYFGEWASSPKPYQVFNGDVEDAARYLKTLDGSQVVMFSTQYYRHYTVLFFERRQLDLRWFDGRQSLPFPEEAQREVVYVFPASAMPPPEWLEVLGKAALVEEGRGPQGQLAFQAYRLSPARLAEIRASLAPPQPLATKLGQEVELLGYRMGQAGSGTPPRVLPGGILPLTLYWRALRRTEADYSFFSHLLDSRGLMWGQGDANEYWSAEWRPGDLVVGVYDIRVDPQALPGRYTLEVGIFDRRTGQRLRLPGGGDAQVLEAVKVAQPAQPSLEGLGRALGVNLGGVIDLLGYGVEGTGGQASLPARTRAGAALDFTFFWRATGPIRADYTVFLHLVDASGRIAAQADSQPQGGGFPTSFWDPGEVVKDEIRVATGESMPLGTYSVRVGLYRLDTGQRLDVSDREGRPLGDYIDLGTVVVSP